MSNLKKVQWTERHSQYTVRDFTALPIYALLEKAVVSYSSETEESKEDCQVTVEGRSLRKELKGSGDVEEIHFDAVQQLRTYKRVFRDADADVTISASKSSTEEWGEVEIAVPAAVKSFELWRFTPTSKEFERYSIRNGERKGEKTGERLFGSGPVETFKLSYTESESEMHSERTWQRGDQAGSEKRHRKGDHLSGESTVTSPIFTETKTYHIDPTRDYGLIQGQSRGRTWTEKWDKCPDSHFEERIMEQSGRVRGYRYEKCAGSENRQEWEGEMKQREDKGKAGEFLEEVKARLMDEVAESERTLKALAASEPSFTAELDLLTREKQSLPASTAQDSLISLIRLSFSLASKQEHLKQRIIDELAKSDSVQTLKKELENLQKASELTLSLLSEEGRQPIRSCEAGCSCQEMLESLQALESSKFAILNARKARSEDKSIRTEVEGILAQETAILAAIQAKVPSSDLPSSLEVLSLPVPEMLKLISERQLLTLSLIEKLVEKGEGGEEGWESFLEEGSDQGLTEVRSKLTSLVKPYQALIEDQQPELMRQLSSLEASKPSLESLPFLFSLLTQAVQLVTKPAPAQPSLAKAVQGLSAILRRAPEEQEEYEEETVVEEVTETSVEEIMEQVFSLESLVAAKDAENNNLKKQVDAKERILAAIREENEDLRRFKGLYYSQKDECDTIEKAAKAGKLVLSDLQLAFAQLQTDYSSLEAQVKSGKEAQIKVAALEKENGELRSTLTAVKQASGGSDPALTSEIAALHNAVIAKDLSLTAAQARIDGLLLEMKAEKSKKERQLLLRLVSTIATILKSEKSHLFLNWKIKSDVPLCSNDYKAMEVLPEISLNWLSRELFSSESTDVAVIAAVEQAYAWVRRVSFRESPVFEFVSKGEMRTNSLLPGEELFAYIEAVMVAKSEHDNLLLQAQKTPEGMGQFLLKHTKATCEDNSVIAAELMSRMLCTLFIQYSHRAPLAILFARLISVFDPFPVVLEGSLLVSKFSQRFTSLLRLPPTKPTTVSEFTLSRSLPLFKLLTSFYDELSTDRIAFAHFLLGIRPKGLSSGDFLCALVHFHANRARRTDSTYLWSCLKGAGKSEGVPMERFVESLRESMWLPEQFLRQAFADLAKGEVLTEPLFSERAKVVKDSFPEGALISQASFLTGVVSGFESVLRRAIMATAKAVFRLSSHDSISETDFTEAVSALNPSLPAARISRMYNYSLKLVGEERLQLPQFLGVLALAQVPVSAKSPYRLEGLDLPEEPVVEKKRMPANLAQFKSLLAASSRLKVDAKG